MASSRARKKVTTSEANVLDEVLEIAPAAPEKIDGVVIGRFVGTDPNGAPLIDVPHSRFTVPIAARSTVTLGASALGRQVAVVFERGRVDRPLVIGLVQGGDVQAGADTQPAVELDGERLVFTADKEIELRCGKASITLTRAGKVLIRGEYLLSRSAGVNRIKGGSIQLN